MQQESHSLSSTVTPSGSNGDSLFNPDEVRFMDDSLSNADLFDPFTVGAPGFKVPNILPANLGGIGSAPREVDQMSNAPLHAGTAAIWSDREQLGRNGNNQISPQQQQQHHHHHHHHHPQQHPHYKRQSQSPITNTARGGYGRDKAWQTQQLEALQAESERYRTSGQSTHSYEDGSSSSMPDFTNASLPGRSLNAMDGDSSWIPQESLPSQRYQNGAYLQQNQQDAIQSSSSTYASQKMPSNAPPSHNLGHLGLQFPSSHQFPAASGNEEASSKRQRRHKGDEEASTSCEGDVVPRRGRSPNARPPWSQAPDLSKISSGDVPLISSSHPGTQNIPNQNNSTSALAQQRGPLNIDFDAPYTYLPAPKPPPKIVDLSKAAGKSNVIPTQISDALFAPKLARYQPHLLLLRREQMKRKERGLSANIRKGDKKVNAKQEQGSPDDDANDGDGEKKKAGHTLLTDAEKKANHIASEQKRRANIRKGYEMLCDLVPALREDGEGDDEIGMEEDGNEGDDDGVKRGKRRRGYETSGGGGGDRIEGRTGPRSEAAILMAAVEHLRSQLEIHKQVVVQKQEAQLRVAQQYGLDIRAEPSMSNSTTNT